MKKLGFLFTLLLLGCSSSELIENWKNPDIVLFDANKVLVVGMAQDDAARDKFEADMVSEFEKRDVEALPSSAVFDVAFTDSRRTEQELDNFEQSLLDKGFDAILLTKVVGSEDRQSFTRTINELYRSGGRFSDDYVTHQDIYYNDSYNDKYRVYHAQTSLYCICEGKERALIWRGSIDIVDPKNVEKAVEDYIKLVVLAMEDQDLIFYDADF